MKKFTKEIIILTVAGFISITCLVSCGSFSNMSYEDAYGIGYGIGTAGRVLIDN